MEKGNETAVKPMFWIEKRWNVVFVVGSGFGELEMRPASAEKSKLPAFQLMLMSWVMTCWSLCFSWLLLSRGFDIVWEGQDGVNLVL